MTDRITPVRHQRLLHALSARGNCHSEHLAVQIADRFADCTREKDRDALRGRFCERPQDVGARKLWAAAMRIHRKRQLRLEPPIVSTPTRICVVRRCSNTRQSHRVVKAVAKPTASSDDPAEPPGDGSRRSAVWS